MGSQTPATLDFIWTRASHDKTTWNETVRKLSLSFLSTVNGRYAHCSLLFKFLPFSVCGWPDHGFFVHFCSSFVSFLSNSLNDLFCCHVLVIFIIIVPFLDDTVTRSSNSHHKISSWSSGKGGRRDNNCSSLPLVHCLFGCISSFTSRFRFAPQEADHGTIVNSFTHDLLLWSTWLSTAGLLTRSRSRNSGSIPADCGATGSRHAKLR